MIHAANQVLPAVCPAHLVGKNAAAFSQAGESEDDSIHLVRVGVYLRRTLGSCVTALLIRPSRANELLRQEAALCGVKEH